MSCGSHVVVETQLTTSGVSTNEVRLTRLTSTVGILG